MDRLTDIKWDGWLEHQGVIKKIKYNIAQMINKGGDPKIVAIPEKFSSLSGSIIMGCRVVVDNYADQEKIYVYDRRMTEPDLTLSAAPNK